MSSENIFRSLSKDGQTPTLNAFNLLLRVLRDCRFADDFQLVRLNDGKRTPAINSDKHLLPKTGNDYAPSERGQQGAIVVQEMRPSLSDGGSGTTSEIVPATTPLSKLTAHQRFRAVGGIDSFLVMMKSMNVRPDVRTFSQMVDLIEPNEASESHLLRVMEERYHLRPDVALLNALIKRRAVRGAFEEAMACVELMTKLRLNADEKTFGCLALGCRTSRDGKQVVRSMLAAGMKPNMPVLDAMITTAIRHFNFDLASFVLTHIAKHRMRVDRRFIAHVHSTMTTCSQILKAEKPSFPTCFPANYREFRLLLLKTLPDIKVDLDINEEDNLQEQMEKIDRDALRSDEEKPWVTNTLKYK
uniref:Uncharacterized protein n=1 Tax=Plectus sambesii TaxID=2011161 RepID=A0A914VKI2_9BILA